MEILGPRKATPPVPDTGLDSQCPRKSIIRPGRSEGHLHAGIGASIGVAAAVVGILVATE